MVEIGTTTQKQGRNPDWLLNNIMVPIKKQVRKALLVQTMLVSAWFWVR